MDANGVAEQIGTWILDRPNKYVDNFRCEGVESFLEEVAIELNLILNKALPLRTIQDIFNPAILYRQKRAEVDKEAGTVKSLTVECGNNPFETSIDSIIWNNSGSFKERIIKCARILNNICYIPNPDSPQKIILDLEYYRMIENALKAITSESVDLYDYNKTPVLELTRVISLRYKYEAEDVDTIQLFLGDLTKILINILRTTYKETPSLQEIQDSRNPIKIYNHKYSITDISHKTWLVDKNKVEELFANIEVSQATPPPFALVGAKSIKTEYGYNNAIAGALHYPAAGGFLGAFISGLAVTGIGLMAPPMATTVLGSYITMTSLAFGATCAQIECVYSLRNSNVLEEHNCATWATEQLHKLNISDINKELTTFWGDYAVYITSRHIGAPEQAARGDEKLYENIYNRAGKEINIYERKFKESGTPKVIDTLKIINPDSTCFKYCPTKFVYTNDVSIIGTGTAI